MMSKHEGDTMKINKFIGRETEMLRLKGLLSGRSASLIVIRGRRRIGKSRLLAEFGKEIKSYFFSGNPPAPKTSAQSQRDVFVQQLERNGIPGVHAGDWGNIFWHLSKHTQKGRVLIVFDEISWMGGKDPEFLGHLKTAWDMYLSKNPHLILALCGSISSWIEKNILSNTGFLGRIVMDMVLEELPLDACNAFWHPKAARISNYEKFKVLSVTGGVPFYLERLKPHLTAEQNIQELCFTKGGLLVREFDEIFSDLFARKKASHKELVTSLANGPKELTQVCKALGKSQGGIYSQYLDELIKAGFIRREYTWDLQSGQYGKLSRYRLSDNYLRFYLKYIAPRRHKIEQGKMPESILNALPNWESVMGLQFENLVTHNYASLWQMLHIAAGDVIMDGPFFQNTTTKQLGCQIDYMIQTKFQTLYLCEIKFKKGRIDSSILDEVEEKRKRIKTPRNFSMRPVLIHVNGVDESVIEAGYFDTIIDFGELLKK